MRLRLSTVDEFQLLTCFKHSIWGSEPNRFKDWQKGDSLAIIVDKKLAALAEISGEPFFSREKIWDNGLYPNRIPLRFNSILLPDDRPLILGEIRDSLTEEWGPSYGWGILGQQKLSEKSAEVIIKSIKSQKNSINYFKENLENLLSQAYEDRQLASKQKSKKKKPLKSRRLKTNKPIKPSKATSNKDLSILPEDNFGSKEEESIHSKAQLSLIQIGKAAGCSVWIASNDRNRKYKGTTLGTGCLKELPNLGLNEEATRRISLIDIIWIKQNSPVCAFEIESTTSIYSGLLRMSDLLSVVSALRMELFIVAPLNRQEKVMGEILRPTFRKIGLSEFCKYISIEDLSGLQTKIEGLSGYIQPSIVNSIALSPEEDFQSSLS